MVIWEAVNTNTVMVHMVVFIPQIPTLKRVHVLQDKLKISNSMKLKSFQEWIEWSAMVIWDFSDTNIVMVHVVVFVP